MSDQVPEETPDAVTRTNVLNAADLVRESLSRAAISAWESTQSAVKTGVNTLGNIAQSLLQGPEASVIRDKDGKITRIEFGEVAGKSSPIKDNNGKDFHSEDNSKNWQALDRSSQKSTKEGNTSNDKNGNDSTDKKDNSSISINEDGKIIQTDNGEITKIKCLDGSIFRVGDTFKDRKGNDINDKDGKPIRIGQIALDRDGKAFGREGKSDNWRALEERSQK